MKKKDFLWTSVASTFDLLYDDGLTDYHLSVLRTSPTVRKQIVMLAQDITVAGAFRHMNISSFMSAVAALTVIQDAFFITIREGKGPMMHFENPNWLLDVDPVSLHVVAEADFIWEESNMRQCLGDSYTFEKVDSNLGMKLEVFRVRRPLDKAS